MPLLMLRRSWPGSFRRSIRDAKGQIVRTVEFLKGEPQEISSAEMPCFEQDIGKALEVVSVDGEGRPRPADWIPPEDRDGTPKKEPKKSPPKKDPEKKEPEKKDPVKPPSEQK